MATRYSAVEAVREYTGNPDLELETYLDPKVPGCVALRDKEGNGYLIAANVPACADNVEEVEFESWPPKSGEPRFFI